MRNNFFKQGGSLEKIDLWGLGVRKEWHKPNFGLRFSERRLLLAIGDLFMLNSALFCYLLIRNYLKVLNNNPSFLLSWVTVLIVLWLGASAFFNVYDVSVAARGWESASYTAVTAIFVTIVYLLIPYLTPTLPNRRLFIFLFPSFAALFIIMWRLLYANLFSQPTFQRRILIVGAGQSGQTLAHAIKTQSTQRGSTVYNIIGFIDDALDKEAQPIDGIPILGDRHNLVQIVNKLHPNELVVANTHAHRIHPDLFKAVLDCREMGIPITTMTHLYETLTGRVPVKHAGHDLQVVMPIDRPASDRLYLIFSRIVELGVAFIGCLLLLILMPIIWLINYFTSPGDLFYHQERIGSGGKKFEVIKFRSMVMNAEQVTGAVWAQENDDRATPIGRLLRKTHLDEIPQFWNVLKGEMSLVGPRPERPSIISQLEKEIPFYRVRHAIKPGITGWAQVCYRYGASLDDSHVKLEYDLYYIKHRSPYLDLIILVKTIRVMLGLKGQ